MFGAALVATEDISAITTMVTDTAEVLVPAGLGILALMVGIALIPRIIYKFL
jgi:hypothetical protein